MKISLVIPAHNEEKYIRNCLLSIQKHGGDLFEVIVINNGSTDNTEGVVKDFKNVILINEAEKGLPFARNRGLSEAKGELVAFIDADTKIPKNWVKKIQKKFSKDNKIVSISGPYIYYDMSIFHKTLVWVYWVLLAHSSYIITGYMAVLGNFVAKKSSLEEIGGFNKDIAFYGDDTDISKRLSKIGKVKFYQSFYMFTSARRLKGEGFIKTAYNYITNFLWVVFTNKAKTNHYNNIR